MKSMLLSSSNCDDYKLQKMRALRFINECTTGKNAYTIYTRKITKVTSFFELGNTRGIPNQILKNTNVLIIFMMDIYFRYVSLLLRHNRP